MTAQDVEDAFDGNVCRCTGYRPILDAMKALPGTLDIEVGGGKDFIFYYGIPALS